MVGLLCHVCRTAGTDGLIGVAPRQRRSQLPCRLKSGGKHERGRSKKHILALMEHDGLLWDQWAQPFVAAPQQPFWQRMNT
eukprot:scaffold148734_cov15-Prasinocladus_malaysianus.AAC.1